MRRGFLGVLLVWLAPAVPAAAQPYTETTVHAFIPSPFGSLPNGLVLARDGNLYGTTGTGGPTADGTLFRITNPTTSPALSVIGTSGCGGTTSTLLQASDGNLYGTNPGELGAVCRIRNLSTAPIEAVIHTFKGGADGASPWASLIQASDGNLYGTTAYGGAHDAGTVFKISNLSTDPTESVVYSFTGGTDGSNPYGALIQASDGNLYGTTASGGSSNGNLNGTVFRISNLTSTPVESVIHSFSGPDGSAPFAALIEGSDHNLYGTTSSGGSSGHGTVFRVSNFSTIPSMSVLHNFTGGVDGGQVWAPLIQGTDGSLYGTTQFGGDAGAGTVYTIRNPNGAPAFSVVHSFSALSDGSSPVSALVQLPDGDLWGSAETGGPGHVGTIFRIMDPAGLPSEDTFFSFQGTADGEVPTARLLQASDGTLYGTTGAANGYDYGTVFRISGLPGAPDERLLHSFSGGSDGASPSALIQASDGSLYGTTFDGGLHGLGTVFKISNPSGTPTQTVIHDFSGGSDGANPAAPLIQAADGSLYGTASNGGPGLFGVVFKISNLSTEPVESVVHSFTGGPDGGAPLAGLILARDGNLYGTTSQGGSNTCSIFRITTGCGVVFKIDNLSSTPRESVVYNFTGGNDGNSPATALVQASDGNLYGTIGVSGELNNGGVYRISDLATNPTFSLIDDFAVSGRLSNPEDSLIQAMDGDLYGTTAGGGAGFGAVFKLENLATSPTESLVYAFSGGVDGARPMSSLTQSFDGKLYGTASGGGPANAGVVFRIDLETQQPPGPCTPSDTTLCVDSAPGDRRFQVQVDFSTGQAGGSSGSGHAVPLAPVGITRGGAFWFFSPDNPEMLVKVLDGCRINEREWFFASAGTNVAYVATVTDTRTGEQKIYTNPDLHPAAPIQDTSLSSCAASSASSSASVPARTASAGSRSTEAPVIFACTPSATALCIDGQPGDRRFKVEVAFWTSQGGGSSGSGQAVPLAPVGITHGGAFWFFSPDNPEMLVKVLDGCAINGQKWFFASAGTNVGYALTLTDTATGQEKIYTNDDLHPADPILDTAAFATCP